LLSSHFINKNKSTCLFHTCQKLFFEKLQDYSKYEVCFIRLFKLKDKNSNATIWSYTLLSDSCICFFFVKNILLVVFHLLSFIFNDLIHSLNWFLCIDNIILKWWFAQGVSRFVSINNTSEADADFRWHFMRMFWVCANIRSNVITINFIKNV
jgi:hypothetical protein